jgi:hypothetical protein
VPRSNADAEERPHHRLHDDDLRDEAKPGCAGPERARDGRLEREESKPGGEERSDAAKAKSGGRSNFHGSSKFGGEPVLRCGQVLGRGVVVTNR